MPNTVNINFIASASGRMTSDIFDNFRYSLAILQVTGSFAGAEIVVEGRTAVPEGPWEALGGWDTRDMGAELQALTSPGIYEFPIDGIRQLRVRVAALGGGSVTVSGVVYDSSDGSVWPDGSSGIRFGDSDLFVKGAAEQIFTDPSTGNIAGYDRVSSEAAVSMTVNLAEISGGMGNRLVGVLPDTVRITGTYTSAAFSLTTREAILGGKLAYDASVPFCERITAESETLRVTKTPVPFYGEDGGACRCYVRDSGSGEQKGTAYGLNPIDGTVEGFTAEAGTVYEVTYYVHNISAQMLPVPSSRNPVIMTVSTRFAVYGRQGKNANQGILRGWLYFIVPRAILSGNAGLDASQTATGTTDGSWIALPDKRENLPFCECGDNLTPAAYYVWVPCGDETASVADIVSIGGGLTLKAGETTRIPVKFVMPDDSLVQPDFTRLGYWSEDDSVASVDNAGMITGEDAGETVVHAYLHRAGGETLEALSVVTVTGSARRLTAMADHISIRTEEGE